MTTFTRDHNEQVTAFLDGPRATPTSRNGETGREVDTAHSGRYVDIRWPKVASSGAPLRSSAPETAGSGRSGDTSAKDGPGAGP
jgi:hypothetical protein